MMLPYMYVHTFVYKFIYRLSWLEIKKPKKKRRKQKNKLSAAMMMKYTRAYIFLVWLQRKVSCKHHTKWKNIQFNPSVVNDFNSFTKSHIKNSAWYNVSLQNKCKIQQETHVVSNLWLHLACKRIPIIGM